MDKKECISALREQMDNAITSLEHQLLNIRTGKASPTMLNGVMVDYYGTMTPIDQVSSINTPDARALVIQPWEKKMLPLIEKAIQNANLGLNPQNNGETIRVPVPPLTEERRRDLVKQAKSEAENTKVRIRAARKEANDMLKQLQKDGMPEDEQKRGETEVQKLTDEYNEKVDALAAEKEKEIMTV